MTDSQLDNETRLAAALANDADAYRGAVDDLARSCGLGPREIAQLTLVPRAERRLALARMLPAVAVAKANEPPAEATSPITAAAVLPAVALKVDHLPTWRLEHLRRHGRG